jgi:hypothetical protein
MHHSPAFRWKYFTAVLAVTRLLGVWGASGAVAAPSDAVNMPPTPGAVTVAVLPFSSQHYGQQKREATAHIIAELSKDRRLALVERADLDKILAEQALDLSRELDAGTAARLGQLSGASAIITGRIMARTQDGGHYRIEARVVETGTGRVFTTEAEGRAEARARATWRDLPATCKILSGKIAEIIAVRAPLLLEQRPKSRTERIEEIVASAGTQRPVVAISLLDTRATNNSTAETALGLILQKAGFTIVDAKSVEKPEVEITGDVTTASGPKRADLSTARASVNIKVRHLAAGRILAFDRETAEAFELGDLVALDGAVEHAMIELAARLVPLLSK